MNTKNLNKHESNKNQMKGGEKMKKMFSLFMMALLCLVFVGSASAGIRNSKHDFSVNSAANSETYSTDEDRMCVFCHTPHNAVENVPLWNRSASVGAFALYTASATLTSSTKASVIDSTNISYKCLTCHDGNVSIGGAVQRGNIVTGAVSKDTIGTESVKGFCLVQSVLSETGPTHTMLEDIRL